MTMQELNLSRRSIGCFDPSKDINMELVKRVINEANFTPSGHNLQPWRLIIAKSKQSKETLHSLAYRQDKVLDAPITLIVIGDKEAYKEDNKAYEEVVEKYGAERKDAIIKSSERVYGEDEIAKVKFAYTNTSLYAMTLMFLFKAYGMETHAISGMNASGIHKAFDLKDSEEVVMLLNVGYFDDSKTLLTRKRRKEFNDMTVIL